MINPKPGERLEAPVKQGPYAKTNFPTKSAPTDDTAKALVAGAPTATRATLDLDAVGEYKGQPVTTIPLDNYEDKPWRKPGADLTDYFNFGFDELTWAAYCSKQDKLSDFTPQKVMAMLGMNGPSSMMGAPMMPTMPGFPTLPGFPGPPGGPNMFGGPPGNGFGNAMSNSFMPPPMNMPMNNTTNNVGTNNGNMNTNGGSWNRGPKR